MEHRGHRRETSRHHYYYEHHKDEHHEHPVKKVRFQRSHSSPPAPSADITSGVQNISLGDDDDSIVPYRSFHPDQDDEYGTWDQPVVFTPDEASYRPKKWLEKLEKLEAQVVVRSGQPGPSLHEPIPDSHSLVVQRAELRRLRSVLAGTSENLRALQRAHFCSQSISMLVLEKGRKEVARLVEVTIAVAQKFLSKAIDFIDHDNITDLAQAGLFLGYCVVILDWMELRPRVLQQFRAEQTGTDLRSSAYYERMWGTGTVTSALVHAMRAVAYTLDIAVVSFCGAHLEPFDEVYFWHHHDHLDRNLYYAIPCDEHNTSAIFVYPRRFDCLSGFLGSYRAWVFETQEGGQVLDLARLLYLRTSPEQLANVWGPLWRAETVERGGASRFMLSNGFLIGSHHSSTIDPPLYEGEYLCHWTDDPKLVSEGDSTALPRYVNINYLLIGAHSALSSVALEVNRHCPTDAGDIYRDLQAHKYLTSLGNHFAQWYLGPFNISISVSPPGGFLGYGTELVFKRRQGISCRDTVCTKLVAQPWRHIGLLGDLYGVEISGCTGNARRRRLVDVILTRAMREFVGSHSQLSWVHDYDKWHHLRTLLLHSPTRPDYAYIYKHTTETQRHDYSKYIKLAVGAIKDLPIPAASEHVDALFAHHNTQYRARLPSGSGDCEWLRLLGDSLTSFSAPVVEVSCLECHPGNILCEHHHHDYYYSNHHHHHHHHHHRHSYDPGYLSPRSSGSGLGSVTPRSPSTSSSQSHSHSRTPSSGSVSMRRSRDERSMSTHNVASASTSSHQIPHSPTGTLLSTTLLLNPLATLPPGLRSLHPHHRPQQQQQAMATVTDEMLRAVPAGSVFDLGDHGELRVLGHITFVSSPPPPASLDMERDAKEKEEEEGGWKEAEGGSGYYYRTRHSYSDGGCRYTTYTVTIPEGVVEHDDDDYHRHHRYRKHDVVLLVERARPDIRVPRTVRYFLEKMDDKAPGEFYHGELVHLNGDGEEEEGGGRGAKLLVSVLVVSDVHDGLIAEWLKELDNSRQVDDRVVVVD